MPQTNASTSTINRIIPTSTESIDNFACAVATIVIGLLISVLFIFVQISISHLCDALPRDPFDKILVSSFGSVTVIY